MRYVNILFFVTFVFALLTVILGFISFIFFAISFISLYVIMYFFRAEDRITHRAPVVSPSDGRITSITSHKLLPDILPNYKSYKDYICVSIVSNFNNIYFKYAPCDGVIEDIKVLNPHTINKHSNFTHKPHRTYVVFHILHLEKTHVFLVVEVLFADRNYDLYTLYVQKGSKVKKGDMLICAHLYSKVLVFLPSHDINVQMGQSLFHNETPLVNEDYVL